MSTEEEEYGEDCQDDFDADGNCLIHDDCDERDHTCGCGECCDACWFDCCASAEGIVSAIDVTVDCNEPITNCGLTPLAQLDFLINEWTTRKESWPTPPTPPPTPPKEGRTAPS